MAPSRSAHVRLPSTLILLLLCVVIVMQMLGTTTSLWTFDFESGTVETALQEGFSLPADVSIPLPFLATSGDVELARPIRSLLTEATLFRPPLAPRSPISLV